MNTSNQQYGIPSCSLTGCYIEGEHVHTSGTTGTSFNTGLHGGPGVSPLDCPECPGTTTEHYPDCGVGSDERYRERTGQ